MLDKNRWNELKKLTIVYSTYDYVEFNGTKYPKAYIVEQGNDKSIDTAKNWASSYSSNSAPQIINTDNSGFKMQIVSAPKNSSQSGKLAFWMCVFTKNDIPAFSAGINSELLNMLILGSDISKGEVRTDGLFFVKLSGQLGVIHQAMPEYQDYLSCLKHKDTTSKNKTKDWKIGYSYVTATKEDVMLGEFEWPLTSITDTRTRSMTYALDLDNGQKYISYAQVPWFDWEGYNRFDSMICHGLYNNYTTCPARALGKKIFDYDDTYKDKVANVVEKLVTDISNKKYMWCRYGDEIDIYELVKYATMLYKLRPEKAIAILKSAKPEVNKHKDIYTIDLEYNGKKETFSCGADFFNRILDIMEQHYAATNA